jgi:hypothetical protein
MRGQWNLLPGREFGIIAKSDPTGNAPPDSPNSFFISEVHPVLCFTGGGFRIMRK